MSVFLQAFSMGNAIISVMKDYQIFTDACCDMNQDILDAHAIQVIPMKVILPDGRYFYHYPDFRNFSSASFYSQVRHGLLTKTDMIPPEEFLQIFRPVLQEGKDILYIAFSSGMSKTYENALQAADVLKKEYPLRTIIAVDSLCACGGEGVFALQAALNKEAGMSITENETWLKAHRLNLSHYFTVGEMDTLKRGGRISPTVAFFSGTFNVKPVLVVDNEGKLRLLGQVHGRKESLQRLILLTEETIVSPETQTLYISETDCYDEALLFKEEVQKQIPCRDVIITRIGPVIGTHTGPEHMCLFSWGTGRYPERFSSILKTRNH